MSLGRGQDSLGMEWVFWYSTNEDGVSWEPKVRFKSSRSCSGICQEEMSIGTRDGVRWPAVPLKFHDVRACTPKLGSMAVAKLEPYQRELQHRRSPGTEFPGKHGHTPAIHSTATRPCAFRKSLYTSIRQHHWVLEYSLPSMTQPLHS